MRSRGAMQIYVIYTLLGRDGCCGGLGGDKAGLDGGLGGYKNDDGGLGGDKDELYGSLGGYKKWWWKENRK